MNGKDIDDDGEIDPIRLDKTPVYLAIMLCFYVDDYLGSFRTIKEARNMKKRLT